jgi:hypothetical protein
MKQFRNLNQNGHSRRRRRSTDCPQFLSSN